jgi:hypothetical protein
MASAPKRLKTDKAAARDTPENVDTEGASLEALRQVYTTISSWEEVAARLDTDVGQCVITGDYKRIMLERYLKTWFLHKDKHVASEVCSYTMRS